MTFRDTSQNPIPITEKGSYYNHPWKRIWTVTN